MTDNKSLGQIAHEACEKHTWRPIKPWRDLMDETQDNYEIMAQAVRRAVIDECIQAVRSQIEAFSSEEYATGQPHSSFGERFACKSCIEALEGLKGETDDAA